MNNISYIKFYSGVDVYTALAGAVGALYGPLHGGANEVHDNCVFNFLGKYTLHYLFSILFLWTKKLLLNLVQYNSTFSL